MMMTPSRTADEDVGTTVFSGSQVLEEDIHATGLSLNVQYVWSPVYVNALVLRDDKYTDAGSFNRLDRVYALQDANYNVTALVSGFTQNGDTNDDGSVGGSDMSNIVQHKGHAVAGGAAVGDLNHDGVVDNTDMTLWQAAIGNTSTSFTWQVTERLTYNAYGAFTTSVRDNAGAWHDTWGDYLGWDITFQGGRYNALTGQVHFGTQNGRDLDITTGRWQSPDIYYYDGLNLYPFCAANPINHRDPTGLACDMGGADITQYLYKIWKDVRQQWFDWQMKPGGTDFLRQVFNSAHGISGFDIYELVSDKSAFGGTGKGKNTVTVAGFVYPSEEVNYFLWGLLANLAEGTWGSNGTKNPKYFRDDGYDNIVAYRVTMGIFVNAWYSLSGGGDYRGQGLNLDGRIGWYWAGYFGMNYLPRKTALKLPPGPPYHGPMSWSIGKTSPLFGGAFSIA